MDNKWSRGEKIAFWTLLITIVAIIIGLTTPEIRKLIRLEKLEYDANNEHQQEIKEPIVIQPSIPKVSNKTESNDYSQTSLDRITWKRDYFKPVKEGTYNIIVQSLDQDFESAVSALKKLEDRFPSVAFRIMPSVASDGISNERYAIVIGQGVTFSEGRDLVKKAKALGIASDAFMTHQDWDVD